MSERDSTATTRKTEDMDKCRGLHMAFNEDRVPLLDSLNRPEYVKLYCSNLNIIKKCTCNKKFNTLIQRQTYDHNS